MLYGHYLQKKSQNMSITCVSINKLRTEHFIFFNNIEERWNKLEGKRTFKLASDASNAKKQKALHAASVDVEFTEFDV